jgi:transposase
MWLAEARECGVRAIETFAGGLEQDGAAVRAALTTPWRNGQAEGQITRLKLIKRTMYGRAGFDLLRRRVLLAA